MDLNYLIPRNDNEKMLKKLLHLLKKILKFCSIESYWKKYWKVLKISTYWTLLKKYWKILILIEPSIEKVLLIEHYWNINNTFSLLYCIALYCIEPRHRCLLCIGDKKLLYLLEKASWFINSLVQCFSTWVPRNPEVPFILCRVPWKSSN